MGNCVSTNDTLHLDTTLSARLTTNQASVQGTVSPIQNDVLTRYARAIQTSAQTAEEFLKLTDICAELSAQKDRIILAIAWSDYQYDLTLQQYRTAAGATERFEHLTGLSHLDENSRYLRNSLKAVDKLLAGRQERVFHLRVMLENGQTEVKMACAGLGEVDRILSPPVR